MNRQTYAAWGKEAVDICASGEYVSPSGKTVDIKNAVDESVAFSKLYTPQETNRIIENMPKPIETHDTIFEVTSETSLVASKRLYEEEGVVTCLNFASGKHPGGGFLTGAKAQEETLARSSALYPSIAQMKEMYNYNRKKWGFYSDYMVFSPNVPVFRKDAGEFEEEPYFVSMITSPAVNAGIIMKSNPTQRHAISQKMKARIRKIIAVARSNEQKVLVLGAFGCGVFGNSPEEVARIFHDVFEEPEYKGYFKRVVFAIYEPGYVKNKPAFDKRFGTVSP